MGRMTVDHQKCLSAPSFHEILQKCDEGFRIQLASVGGCPKFSARVDRADHIEALPLTGGYHLGRFALQPISAAQGGIRLKSRLVQKENLGPQPFGSPLVWVRALRQSAQPGRPSPPAQTSAAKDKLPCEKIPAIPLLHSEPRRLPPRAERQVF